MTSDERKGITGEDVGSGFDVFSGAGLCGFLCTSLGGVIIRVNETFADWLGDDHAYILGRRFQDYLTTSGKIFYENRYVPTLLLQGAVKEVMFDLVRQVDPPLAVLVNSVLREAGDGHSGHIVYAMFEATERRAYERELVRARTSAEQLAAVVELSSDAILRMSPQCVIETWNDGAAGLFGILRREILGTDLREVVQPLEPDRDWSVLLAEIAAGRSVQTDMVGRGRNDEHIDVSVGLTPHVDHLGTVESVSVIMRNIAERRAIQEVQRDFLAVTTHELRTPVTGIKGNAQLMKRRGTYHERGVNTIITQAKRLERLIDDLLLASRIQDDVLTLVVSECDLMEIVRESVGLLDADATTVIIDGPAEPVMLRADPLRYSQVLTNLLGNALKYSAPDQQIIVRVTLEKAEAIIAVIDHGKGIPAESLPFIFERFYRVTSTTRHVQGLGLGLYICRRIVEAHGGRIDVESLPDAGSTFTVTIPIGQ